MNILIDKWNVETLIEVIDYGIDNLDMDSMESIKQLKKIKQELVAQLEKEEIR